MASWGELLTELQDHPGENGDIVKGIPISELRRKYLQILHEHTKRNVIAYYSGWLKNAQRPNLDINDSDMTGFMQCLNGMDCEKGLDLVLHTPGGNPTAAEGIVNYLHAKFGENIRVIVPHMAMSAGTMLACSAKSIVMGKQSCLGPIDPQYNGVPAYNIMMEYQNAKQDMDSNPNSKTYWELQLLRYPSAFFYTVRDGITLSGTLVAEWLKKYMFKDAAADEVDGRIKNIVGQLNDNNMSHSRHFGMTKCKDLGLIVEELEADNKLQDAVLSVHHAFTITFDREQFAKIIMNHLGQGYFLS